MNRITRSVTLLLALGAMCGCAARSARAQFLGYVSPQSTAVQVFNNQSCSAGTLHSSAIQNIGQSFHSITYTVSGSNTPVDVFIEGSNDGNFWQQISDSGVASPLSGSGIVAGYGNYPYIRATILNGSGSCLANVYYNGSSAPAPNPETGQIDTAAYRKVIFTGATAGSNSVSPSFLPPYGSAGGEIVFNWTGSANGPSGSSVYVQCFDTNGAGWFAGIFPISTLTNSIPIIFQIPARPCSSIAVQYNSGGTSTDGLNAEYYFLKPGQGDTPPCGLSAVISTATSAQILPPAGLGSLTASIHICSIDLSSSTAESVQLTQGTGTSCGTGTTNLSGAVHLAANTPFSRVYPGTGLVSGVAQNVCLTVSSQTDGTITYSYY